MLAHLLPFPRWYIRLLGGLRLQSDADEFTPSFRSRRGTLLLAYLALYPGVEHSREKLVELLWDEAKNDQRTSLQRRRSLSADLPVLRRVLEPDATEWAQGGARTGQVLITDREIVCLNAALIHTDVAELEASLRLTDRSQTDWQRLQRAVDLYRTSGELLPGFYERWVEDERDRLRTLYHQSLQALIAQLEAVNEPLAALSYALTARAEDPEEEGLPAVILRLEGQVSKSPKARKQREVVSPLLAANSRDRVRGKVQSRPSRSWDQVLDAASTALASLPLAARRLFPQLLFAGAFTVEMVSSICRITNADKLLQCLVDAHLVVEEKGSDELDTEKQCLFYRVPERLQSFSSARLPLEKRRWLMHRYGAYLLTVLRSLHRQCYAHKTITGKEYQLLTLARLGRGPENITQVLCSLLESQDADARTIRRGLEIVIHGHGYLQWIGGAQMRLYWEERAYNYRERLPGSRRLQLLRRFLSYSGTSRSVQAEPNEVLQLVDEVSTLSGERRTILLFELAVNAHHNESDELAGALFDEVLRRPLPKNERLNVLINAAESLGVRGDLPGKKTYLEEALRLAEDTGSAYYIAAARGRLANALVSLGEFNKARQLFEMALDFQVLDKDVFAREQLLRDLGLLHISACEWGQAKLVFSEALRLGEERDLAEPASVARRGLGMVALCQSDLQRARGYLEDGLTVWREKDHRRWQAIFLLHLAEVAFHAGDSVECLSLIEEAESYVSRTNAMPSKAWALWLRGRLALRAGSAGQSLSLHRGALALRMQYVGVKPQIESLEDIAAALTATENADDLNKAAELFGASQKLRETLGMPLPPLDHQAIKALESVLIQSLPKDVFTQAVYKGRAMALSRVLMRALEIIDRTTHSPDRPEVTDLHPS